MEAEYYIKFVRTYKFRGQSRRFGEKIRNFAGEPMDSNWVYGPGLLKGNGDFSVIYTDKSVDKHVVYTDSVCQYTGRNDKNGTEIYDGDIVKIAEAEYVVRFSELSCSFVLDGRTGTEAAVGFFGLDSENIEVIGNIFDEAQKNEFYGKDR